MHKIVFLEFQVPDLTHQVAIFLLTNRSVSQRRNMSSLSKVLRLWQLLRKMLSKSLIIVKNKAYET
nr:MAG TPA: hypothetical protein [Caudoviricetes sp.]